MTLPRHLLLLCVALVAMELRSCFCLESDWTTDVCHHVQHPSRAELMLYTHVSWWGVTQFSEVGYQIIPVIDKGTRAQSGEFVWCHTANQLHPYLLPFSLSCKIGLADSQTWFSLPEYTRQVRYKDYGGAVCNQGKDVYFYWIATPTPTFGYEQDRTFIQKEIWGTTMQTKHPKQRQACTLQLLSRKM